MWKEDLRALPRFRVGDLVQRRSSFGFAHVGVVLEVSGGSERVQRDLPPPETAHVVRSDPGWGTIVDRHLRELAGLVIVQGVNGETEPDQHDDHRSEDDGDPRPHPLAWPFRAGFHALDIDTLASGVNPESRPMGS